MTGYVLKRAGDLVRVDLDWRRGHLRPDERVAALEACAVHPDRFGDKSLAVTTTDHDDDRTRLTLEGGRVGSVFMLTTWIRTSGGRAFCRTIVVRIAPDLPPG
jgi:hypothetical protein